MGTMIGSEPFTDVDFTSSNALLTEMLSVLVLALMIIIRKPVFLASKLTGIMQRFRLLTSPSFVICHGLECQLLVTMSKSLSQSLSLLHVLVLKNEKRAITRKRYNIDA